MAIPPKRPSIWWIRRDIRLQDNPTLAAALENGTAPVPVFILEPELMADAAPKRRDFLLNALSDLDGQLRQRGSRLVVREGPALPALKRLTEELDGAKIFAQEDFSPYARRRDARIAGALPLRLLPGQVLRHPTEILKADGSPYIVFTPYKNKWNERGLPSPANVLSAPNILPAVSESVNSLVLPNAELDRLFPATALAAQTRLYDFLAGGIQHYQSRRDRLDRDGTSQLSPYLRFGLLSARECFVKAQLKLNQINDVNIRQEIRTWMDELVWREFYTSILFHFPQVMKSPFRKDYARIPWRTAPDDLHAWQQRSNGIPGRGCLYASAACHRLDAQPRPNDRRFVPH